MKKIFNKKYLLYALLALLIIIVLAIKFPQYKFGYFTNAGQLNFEHANADIFLLKNNNILILGNSFENIPSEIFNIKTQKSSLYTFHDSLKYTSDGVLLNNTQLFLFKTCIKNDCGNSIIYNLESNTIDYVFNKTFGDKKTLQNYLLLNNKNVFYTATIYKDGDHYNELGLFDIHKKTYKSSKINIELHSTKSVQLNDNEILLINVNSAYIYNINSQKLKTLDFPYGKIANNKSNIQRISNLLKIKDKIYILMYLVDDNLIDNYNLALMYDIKTKKFSQVSASSILRDYDCFGDKNVSNIIALDNNLLLITGGLKPPNRLISLLQGHEVMKTSAEIYDVNNDRYYNIVNMPVAKSAHKSLMLDNGDILIIAGRTANSFLGGFRSNENRRTVKFKRIK